MIRRFQAVCLAAVLSACSPPAPPAAPPAASPEAPVPGEAQAEAFPNCQWGEVTGAGVSIWSFACPGDRLIADDSLPGFQRETRDEAGAVVRVPVIRFFSKPADAPIDAVLADVRAASPGSETCVLEPGSHGDFVLMPTGAAFEAHQRFIRGEADGPSMPCGPLGPREAGGHTFRLLKDAPDRVVMINWPSDVPIFDPDTLRVTGK